MQPLTLADLDLAISRRFEPRFELAGPLVVPNWVMRDPAALTQATLTASHFGFCGVIGHEPPPDPALNSAPNR